MFESAGNKAVLILENGMRFHGRAFGFLADCGGVVTFSTHGAGETEFITDPANAGRIVVMTNPAAGNYGATIEDMEADEALLRGIVVREKCDAPSNWRCELELDGFLKQLKVVGIEGIDTRALTRVIRTEGMMKGIIQTDGKEPDEQETERLFSQITPPAALRTEVETLPGSGKRLAVIDFGIKKSAVKELTDRGFHITLLPACADKDAIEGAKPDILLVSSGAAEISEGERAAETIGKFIGSIPVFGVGFGFAVLGAALGCKIKRLKYGHVGGGITVKEVSSGRLVVTAQNHDYTVDSLPEGVKPVFININDGTLEGISHDKLTAYGVAFEPKTRKFGGDSGTFYDMMKRAAEGGGINA